MFTPPPSPLPPRTLIRKEPSLPPSEEEEEPSGDELEYVPYPDGVDPPTPALAHPKRGPASPLSPTSPISAWSYSDKKSSRRRIVIPLLAALLVVVAIASRFSPTRRAAEIWEAPPSSPHVQLPTAPSHKRQQSWTRHLRKPTKRKPNSDLPTPIGAAAPSPSASGILTTISTNGTSPSIPDPPFPVPTPFPQPFDTTFSYNFSTSSCQSFFANSLLSNITFRECRPFSLLMSASTQFFNSQTNLTLLTAIIGGTCDTPESLDECGATMSYFSTELQKDTVCGKDLSDRNAIVLEALNGFMNYGFLRQAGCLINQRTNSYCYVDAVAAFPPSDIYYYNLALGIPLPNNTQPTCSTCTESLLNIYAAQATNATLDISKTYPAAADKAIAACGAKYATAMDAVSGAELRRVVPWLWASAALVVAVSLGSW